MAPADDWTVLPSLHGRPLAFLLVLSPYVQPLLLQQQPSEMVRPQWSVERRDRATVREQGEGQGWPLGPGGWSRTEVQDRGDGSPGVVTLQRADCPLGLAVRGCEDCGKKGTGHIQGKEHPFSSPAASKESPRKPGGRVARAVRTQSRGQSSLPIPPSPLIACAVFLPSLCCFLTCKMGMTIPDVRDFL